LAIFTTLKLITSGFIVANVPGALVGAYAGNRLGAIRDAKGKSVAAGEWTHCPRNHFVLTSRFKKVFNQLGGQEKAAVRA
jgi:hypothetical protein